MPEVVVCEDCNHEGDGQEFTYFTEQPSKYRYVLQCPICGSQNCKREKR